MSGKVVWVLVADGASARLLRADSASRRLELLREAAHAASRARVGDLTTDRLGRRRRDTSARHIVQGHPPSAPHLTYPSDHRSSTFNQNGFLLSYSFAFVASGSRLDRRG